MKNVRKNQLRKAIFMDTEEFEKVIEKATAEYPLVDYSLEGICYKTNNFTENEINERLSEYFGVNVTSIHSDNDADYLGIWIVYRD